MWPIQVSEIDKDEIVNMIFIKFEHKNSKQNKFIFLWGYFYAISTIIFLFSSQFSILF
jgi:hypothetical protein